MIDCTPIDADFCPGRHDTLKRYYRRSILKNGKPGKRLLEDYHWYTPLFHCGLCGVWGSPRRVCYRGDCHSYGLGIDSAGATLCMGCWNKVRAQVRKYNFLQELKTLANRLARTRAA